MGPYLHIHRAGVQEISFAQKHSTQILLNTATIATFFSAVAGGVFPYPFVPLFIVRQCQQSSIRSVP
jgi:hypothetical protein